MKHTIRSIALLLGICMMLAFAWACAPADNNPDPTTSVIPTETASAETFEFTDSCGRVVELPTNITAAAPSGRVAEMLLYAMCPDKMVGWSTEQGDAVRRYFEAEYLGLPVFGQFYGSGAALNMEALVAAAPQVIIDLGNAKDGHKEDMDSIQTQTGIPTIFIEATMDDLYCSAITTLGELLGCDAVAAEMTDYIKEAGAFAANQRAALTAADTVGVYFGTGETGLDANAAGSIHATLLDIVGVRNVTVVDEVSSRGGGNPVNMEQLYNFAPDKIILEAGSAYPMVIADPTWAELDAVANGEVYEIPSGPFSFISSPPSVNQIIGIYWLGKVAYPTAYESVDIVAKTQEFYDLFWHYDLSEDEAHKLMANSLFKTEN